MLGRCFPAWKSFPPTLCELRDEDFVSICLEKKIKLSGFYVKEEPSLVAAQLLEASPEQVFNLGMTQPAKQKQEDCHLSLPMEAKPVSIHPKAGEKLLKKWAKNKYFAQGTFNLFHSPGHCSSSTSSSRAVGCSRGTEGTCQPERRKEGRKDLALALSTALQAG